MAHGGTAPTWEEQQGPRLGASVSRGVSLLKAPPPHVPPRDFGGRGTAGDRVGKLHSWLLQQDAGKPGQMFKL